MEILVKMDMDIENINIEYYMEYIIDYMETSELPLVKNDLYYENTLFFLEQNLQLSVQLQLNSSVIITWYNIINAT